MAHFGKIDVHAHLIPGVDDGCQTIEDSLACAREYVRNGYTHAFCTPHVWPTLQENRAERIGQRTKELQQRLDQESIPLTLLPGGEINLEWNWPAIGKYAVEEVVTYALAGRYVLFDFWADMFPEFLPPAAKHLQSLGLKLVMAHPERIKCVQDDPASVDRFLEMGILLQCNTWCLTDRPGLPTRDVSERLLREKKYFLLGTDLHNFKSMKPRMDGVRVAADIVGEAEVKRLTEENPLLLIPSQMIG